MKRSRRNFIKQTTAGTLAGSLFLQSCTESVSQKKVVNTVDYEPLDKILAQPVVKKELFSEPLIIDRLELLRYENNFICRVTTKDGAEGLSVSNNMQMIHLYPIFTGRLQPFFIGRDARDLEQLLEEVYVYKSNYKLQSLALWVPLATIEFAILDLLGQVANIPIGKVIGEIHHPEIAVYQANNNRGETPEKSLEDIQRSVAETDAQALKFKVAGRMGSPEEPVGRSEQLIPMVREAFGPDMTIYADANGGYDVAEAIRIGKIMEEYNFDFFEEPVPFDYYEETRAVADGLTVPIAGGEQEPSLHNFRWLIGNNALQVVQPDIFYFGGMVRSMKVARMGAHYDKLCVPHISGSGLGYLYMMHYVSAVPNAGPYHEFKGFNNEIPLECPTSDLQSHGGTVKVPTGPGLGVNIDPEYIARHRVVS
ncbi:MAG: mandelate racemase/muconate lactonizing enzyme family protein [Candidatus Cyclobacteriaceae bacterium M3_2C_046]